MMYRIMFACFMMLLSCAPVLNRSSIEQGERKVSFNALRNSPGDFKGKSFVFGGVIVSAKMTAEGSELEIMHVPVDRYGHFEDRGRSEGRYLAIMPPEQGMLDPEVYVKGRRITLAAQFQELRKGKIDEMEYAYPVFLIREIYLWPRERKYNAAYYYYDPWFYPFPYYYYDPWWRYPYYYNYYSYPGGPPRVYRRHRPSDQRPLQAPRRLEPAGPDKLPDTGHRPERRFDRR